MTDCHKKRRVKDLNKKIKKYMEEIHKTEQKIADLQQYLNGIQEGTVKFQVSQESEEEGTGSFVFTEKKEEGHPYGEMEKTE